MSKQPPIHLENIIVEEFAVIPDATAPKKFTTIASYSTDPAIAATGGLAFNTALGSNGQLRLCNSAGAVSSLTTAVDVTSLIAAAASNYMPAATSLDEIPVNGTVDMNSNQLTNVISCLLNDHSDPVGAPDGAMYYSTDYYRPKVKVLGSGWQPMPLAIEVMPNSANLNYIASHVATTASVPMATNIFTDLGLGINPTDSASVQNIINAAPSGGVFLTAPGTPQSITGGTYVSLAPDATFTSMPSNNFTTAGNSFTYTGADTMNIRFTAILTAQIATLAQPIKLYFALNGSDYSPVMSANIVTPATDTEVYVQYIIPMNTGDIVTLWGTLTTSDTLTINEFNMIASSA